MKKLILMVLAMALISSISFSQVWYPANQKTIAWDAVTQCDDGSPIPAGETVRYQIYIALESDLDKANKVNVGATTATSHLITFPEGKWFVGIFSERMQGETVVSTSASISWSNDTVVCQNGETFGISFFRMLKNVINLRPM